MIDKLEDLTNCLNCQEPLADKATYCYNCGQKITDGRISLKEFFNNFIDNVFNLDSRIFRTISQLFIPGRLTIEYFKGKHKSYYHPIRLYLVMSLAFFAILSLKKGTNSLVNFNISNESESMVEKAAKEKYFLLYKTNLDSISQTVLRANTHPKAQEAIDSLYQKLPSETLKDSIDITLINKEFKISMRDAMTQKPDALIEQYEITNFWEKIMAKQGLRTIQDQDLLARQLASNLPIMLLIMMPLLALALKLLYFRRKRYFIEHLVFSFHHHAFAFSLFVLLFLFNEKYYSTLVPIGFLTVLIFLFIAMKRVYQQGYFKTFFKFCVFNMAYFFLFVFALLITLIISFLLF